jgi:hypothetical protein
MSISVSIDIDDILWGMSDREKQKLIDELYEDGFIPEELESELNQPTHAAEAPFVEALDKLKGKYNMLTAEEEQIIIKIANRF